MSKQHARETLTFEGFSGYYGSLTQGYGGLDYSDVDYLNATYWENDKTNWCDTGYQNAIHGAGEAFTQGANGDSFGLLETSNLKETFTLTSMVAASAWETNQPFYFTSYIYDPGKGFVKKASVEVHLSQTPQTIDFGKFISAGNPGDFQNIAAVRINSGTGTYGNTCSYGPNYHTYGNEMAFDNVKIKWNGKTPHGASGKLVTKGLSTHLHHQAAHLVAQLVGSGQHDGVAHEHPAAPAHHADGSGYHTQLLSLAGEGPGGLTNEFHSPVIEHFGP